ncbi:autotransporter domain-containing protein [Bradyrhizobium sp. INPA03-11B]|uniref:autotransporter family protein n=1 Tax=Bradyrhizobium sp. INPA03-11B TaxID=418598 RepID=UPI00338FAD69
MWTERTRALRALLAGVVVIWAAPVMAAPVADATWSTTPGSGDFNTATNWNPNFVPTGTAIFDTSTITSLSFSAATQLGGFTFNPGASAYSFSNNQTLVFTSAGIVINGGSAFISNNPGGILQFSNASTAGSAVITNASGGGRGLVFTDNSTAGNAVITNSSALAFLGAATAGGASITNIGTGGVLFLNTSTAGNAVLTNSNAGTFDFSRSSGPNNDHKVSAGSIAGGGNFYLGADQLTVGGNNLSTVVSGVISDCGGGSDCFNRAHPTGGSLVKIGTGTLGLSGINTYTGGTTFGGGVVSISADYNLGAASGALTFNGGTLQLGGSLNLAITRAITLNAGGGTIDTNGFNMVIAQSIDGIGGLTKSGAGILILAGQNTYTGATAVDGGVLDVKGLINTASGVTVNSGGTLEGTGVVSTATVNNGGTLAPGNAGTPGEIVPGERMTISGNLAFQSGAIYLVQLNPSAASFVSVGGTATLGGATVNAIFASGSYVSKQYTILTAGAVSGTFGSFVNTNLPANFHDSLSYDANNVYLNLALNFGIPNSLNGNQQAVGNALTNFFNSTGGIPMTYAMLTASQLSQASGELGTGSQQTTFQAMGQFMGLLTDPFTNRTGGANATPGATGYADEELGYASKRDAYAMFTKAPPAKVYDPRWSVWAAGYGGSQSTSGNAVAGMNDTTSSIYGTAVGADYLFSPNTIAGFSLAGGGTNFSVAGSGSGHSDLFQAGAYVRHTQGAAYVSAALAYGWQDITTNRTVTIAGIDQLRAEFNANAYSGRVEGGYRFVAPWVGGIGITPYAAGQFTTFDLPAYAESVVSGSPAFALAYGAKDVTDVRSELGFRTDKSFAVPNGVLTLRSRFAWAHDFDPSRAVAATFQALPGASFVVNGAAQASDSALTTASLEMKWMNGWSVAATFEGEFSSVTTSYAGKGALRCAW